MMEAPLCWRQSTAPSLPEKLALASVIASAILQLHNTPWLSSIMTSHTLYLARFDGVASFNQVYISKSAPEETCRHGLNCRGPCEDSTSVMKRPEGFGNELMWALFMLLIEVILWRTMETILCGRLAADLAREPPCQIFDYTTEQGFSRVQNILSKVTMVGGQEYCSAVEWCLKLAFGYPKLNLEQEGLRQQIYDNIVTPIEASCESSQTLTIVQGGIGATY
jgi:hypothetical protein